MCEQTHFSIDLLKFELNHLFSYLYSRVHRWNHILKAFQQQNAMDANDSLNSNQLDKSLELNLSFDPCYDITESVNLDYKQEPMKLVEMAVQHYLKHNLTLVCLEDTLKLMNLSHGCRKELPSSKYLIFKKFGEHTNTNMNILQYHVQCSKCNIYSKRSYSKHGNNCDKCHATLIPNETNFFIYIPIKDQLIQSLKLNWSHIQQHNSSLNGKSKNLISDVDDASLMKKLCDSFSGFDLNVMSLTLNTDGANNFKSNSTSLWPIQIVQNFLPPEIRYKAVNILTVGLYYNNLKPDCKEYFNPLVSELKELANDGLVFEIADEMYQFLPLITHCVVDLPAKRMLQCIKQYNGRRACTYCKHPGCDIQNLGKKKVIRYTDGSYPQRTQTETLKAMHKAHTCKTEVDGVMEISPLVSLPRFQIIEGFGIDPMHCVDLGVTRKLLNFFVNTKYHERPFYLNKKKMVSLEKTLMSIKPISEINRRPRPFKYRSNYKASEYRSLLLYYLPVCLINILPVKHVKNFQQFSFAIYTMLKSTITNLDLIVAEKNLKEFVHDYQILYGQQEMVMNVHNLTHIVESVKCLGPLWTQSAYPFEKNNGILLKNIRGTSDVMDQISSKYILRKGLQKSFQSKNNNVITFIGRSIQIKATERIYEDDSVKYIELTNENLMGYRGVKINGRKFTSRLYTRSKKTIDYFIGLKSGTIGIAKYYLYHNKIKYVVLEEYEVLEYIGHILDVEPTTMYVYAPVDSINKKYTYMNVNKKEYIVCMPNMFEIE